MANKGLVIGIIAVGVAAIGVAAYVISSKNKRKKEEYRRKQLESKLTSEQRKQYEKITPEKRGEWLNKTLNIVQTGLDIYKQFTTPPKENLAPANTLGDPTPDLSKRQGSKQDTTYNG